LTKSRFSGKRQFKKIDIDTIPNNKPIVYKILNSRGNNIYTGSAKKGRSKGRLKEHLPTGAAPIKGGRFFNFKQLDSIQNAQKEERKIIDRENPKLNKLNNTIF